GPLRRQALPEQTHRQQELSDGLAYADDPVDARAEEGHVVDGIQEAQVTDDAAVENDAHGQATRGHDPVRDRRIGKAVHDVVTLRAQLRADRTDRGEV